MPSVLAQIFDRVKPTIPDCRELHHKKTWNAFLKTGIPPFDVEEFKHVLDEVLRIPGNEPQGDKLMLRRKTYSFTLYEDGRVLRTEEGLERLLVASNRATCWNQVSIGGGKESVDFMHLPSDGSGEFIELKAWTSQDTPLYAIIESLKNLELYRLLEGQGLAEDRRLNKVGLVVLAPLEYYRSHGLDLYEDGSKGTGLEAIEHLLKALETVFSGLDSHVRPKLPLREFLAAL